MSLKRRKTEFGKFRGEASLLVWCTWRLDGKNGPLASSDEEPPVGAKKLRILKGKILRGVELFFPGWDLSVDFSQGLVLRVFCDHVPGNPSYHLNWQLRIRDQRVFAGPGKRIVIKKTKESAS
jgi:hypothetical protein